MQHSDFQPRCLESVEEINTTCVRLIRNALEMTEAENCKLHASSCKWLKHKTTQIRKNIFATHGSFKLEIAEPGTENRNKEEHFATFRFSNKPIWKVRRKRHKAYTTSLGIHSKFIESQWKVQRQSANVNLRLFLN